MQEYSVQKIFSFPMSSISKRQCMLPPWGSHISLGEWYRTKPISPCDQPLPAEIGGIWRKLLINPLLAYLGLKGLSSPQCSSHWGKQRKDCRKRKIFSIACLQWLMPGPSHFVSDEECALGLVPLRAANSGNDCSPWKAAPKPNCSIIL